MARGGQKSAAAAAVVQTPVDDETRQLRRELMRSLEDFESRVRRSVSQRTFDTQQQREMATVKAMDIFSASEQKRLVAIAQQFPGDDAEREMIFNRCAELLILTNTRQMLKLAPTRLGSGDGYHLKDEDYLQACRVAILTAMRKFDPNHGASFLTYAKQWMRAEMTALVRNTGFMIRPKANRAEVAERVKRAIKDAESRGLQATPQLVADMVGDSPEVVAEIWPIVSRPMLWIDQQIDSSDSNSGGLGDLLADPNSAIESPIIEGHFSGELRALMREKLTPAELLVVSRYWNLDEDADVNQNDLFDGVFRDPVTGKAYAIEQSVVSDRKARLDGNLPGGEVVTKIARSQVKNGGAEDDPQLFVVLKDASNKERSRFQVVFEPGTPEARQFLRLTGQFPDQHVIQTTLTRAYEKLRPSLLSIRSHYAYRGQNAIENSEVARERVRLALLRLAAGSGGKIKSDDGRQLGEKEIAKLKYGKADAHGAIKVESKSELRKLAEHYGLVNARDGRPTARLDQLAPMIDESAQSAAAEEERDDELAELSALMSE